MRYLGVFLVLTQLGSPGLPDQLKMRYLGGGWVYLVLSQLGSPGLPPVLSQLGPPELVIKRRAHSIAGSPSYGRARLQKQWLSLSRIRIELCFHRTKEIYVYIYFTFYIYIYPSFVP